ncbi:putative sugar O-methyltransferase [Leptospira alexanderi]|uniref:putative sugar O-methyltransferase n=1 Tax=Leptospira alexanderi TaxID=100053 RepID=UPI002014C3C8|nr:putative sugar O-methyltransferase [Leptospira alexanderi]
MAESEELNGKFYEHWKDLKDWLSKSENRMEKSSMWNSLIRDFQISDFEEYEKKYLLRSNTQNGYGFLKQTEENLYFRITKVILELYCFVAKIANLIKEKAFNKIIIGLGNDNLSYHPLGIQYLTKNTNVEKYYEFCKAKGLSIFGAGIKAFYISTILDKLNYSILNKLNIVEIGAGLGNLASILQYRFRVHTYLIVDLPEMLLNSSLVLKYLFPNIPIHFIFPNCKEKISFADGGGVYLCVPEALSSIPKDFFDCAINIDSFQEMTESQIKLYIDLIQKICKKKAHFININRRKKLEVEGFDNNPLLYPYHNNRVLKWEEDRFMGHVYNYSRGRIDGWILRIEEINKK